MAFENILEQVVAPLMDPDRELKRTAAVAAVDGLIQTTRDNRLSFIERKDTAVTKILESVVELEKQSVTGSSRAMDRLLRAKYELAEEAQAVK